jgi:hypothetical protein
MKAPTQAGDTGMVASGAAAAALFALPAAALARGGEAVTRHLSEPTAGAAAAGAGTSCSPLLPLVTAAAAGSVVGQQTNPAPPPHLGAPPPHVPFPAALPPATVVAMLQGMAPPGVQLGMLGPLPAALSALAAAMAAGGQAPRPLASPAVLSECFACCACEFPARSIHEGRLRASCAKSVHHNQTCPAPPPRTPLPWLHRRLNACVPCLLCLQCVPCSCARGAQGKPGPVPLEESGASVREENPIPNAEDQCRQAAEGEGQVHQGMELLWMLWKAGHQGRAAHMGKSHTPTRSPTTACFASFQAWPRSQTDVRAHTRMLSSLQVVPDAVAATTTETTKAEADAHTQAHNEEMNNKAGAAEVDS